MGFSSGSDCKESACNAGNPSLITESRRHPGETMTTHSSIFLWRIPWTEGLMGYSSWFTKSSTRLSDKHLHIFHFFTLGCLFGIFLTFWDRLYQYKLLFKNHFCSIISVLESCIFLFALRHFLFSSWISSFTCWFLLVCLFWQHVV